MRFTYFAYLRRCSNIVKDANALDGENAIASIAFGASVAWVVPVVAIGYPMIEDVVAL